jgi:hypothetical protein
MAFACSLSTLFFGERTMLGKQTGSQFHLEDSPRLADEGAGQAFHARLEKGAWQAIPPLRRSQPSEFIELPYP